MHIEIPQIIWQRDELGMRVWSLALRQEQKDEFTLVTCGDDTRINIWRYEPSTGKLLYETSLEGHQESVNKLAFSIGGKLLASGSQDGTVTIWHIDKFRGTALKKIRCLSPVTDLSWNTGSKVHLLAASLECDTVAILDTTAGRVLHRLDGHTNIASGVAWGKLCGQRKSNPLKIPKGAVERCPVLCSVSHDQSARFWKLLSQKEGSQFRAFCTVRNFERTGGMVYSDVQEKAHTGKQLLSESAVSSFVRRPCTSPCGAFVAVPCGSLLGAAAVHIYCPAITGSTPVFSLPSMNGEVPIVCRFAPFNVRGALQAQSIEEDKCSSILAVGHLGGAVSVWILGSKGPLLCINHLHQQSITDIQWLSDRLSIVTTSTDGYVSFTHLQGGGFIADTSCAKYRSVNVDANSEEEGINSLDICRHDNWQDEYDPSILENLWKEKQTQEPVQVMAVKRVECSPV